MSAENIAERDVVLRQREAFARGYLAGMGLDTTPNRAAVVRALARKAYPLPKIERPRVLRDDSMDTQAEFRVRNGVLEARARDGGDWGQERLRGWYVNANVVRTFSALLDSPTELVEDADPRSAPLGSPLKDLEESVNG